MADETPKLWGTADTYKRYMAPPSPVRLTLAAAPPAIYWRAIWSKAIIPAFRRASQVCSRPSR